MINDEILLLPRMDLACYAAAMWPPFQLAAHHCLIVNALEAVERGEIRRLMIFMPPRHGKSLLASHVFPSWYLGRHPDRSIIATCYGQELADDFGRRVRNMVTDPLHRAIFPEFRVADDSTSMRRFDTTAGGSYFAVGRGGPITGRGAHLLLIDDPLKGADEARSEVTRRALCEWYSSVAYTRLQTGGAVILISTRWHQDDLAGHLYSRTRMVGLSYVYQPSRNWMTASAWRAKRCGQRNIRSPISRTYEPRLAPAHLLPFTNSTRLPQKGRFSKDNGGVFTVSPQSFGASSQAGTQRLRKVRKATFLLAPYGVWPKTAITCCSSGAAKLNFRNSNGASLGWPNSGALIRYSSKIHPAVKV